VGVLSQKLRDHYKNHGLEDIEAFITKEKPQPQKLQEDHDVNESKRKNKIKDDHLKGSRCSELESPKTLFTRKHVDP